MLHLFHLDAASAIIFDINLAVETVQRLQDEISGAIGVAHSDQVLLVSGGYALEPSQRLSIYGAGTDSNPIFLINRSQQSKTGQHGQSSSQQCATSCAVAQCMANSGELQGMFGEVQRSQAPSLELIRRLTELGKRILHCTDTDVQLCSQLVTEQHIMQQGWFAVVANLEDTIKSFNARVAKLDEQYAKYLARRSVALSLLTSFSADMELLKNIPLLPSLLGPSSSAPRRANNSSQCLLVAQTDAARSASSAAGDGCSLLSWISAQDPDHSLFELSNEARSSLEHFDERSKQALFQAAAKATTQAQDPQMMEIRGLRERLGQLDLGLQKIRTLQQDQTRITQSLTDQEQKCSTYYDQSIFTQLLESHMSAVALMLKRYLELNDFCKRFNDAKLELLRNIQQRLAWVVFVQEELCDVDNKILLCLERFRRIRHLIDICRQLHEAPTVYCVAIAEVLRRKMYSKEFLDWAVRLAEKVNALREEELSHRRRFVNKIGKHFLTALFPGMNDEPPSFACVAPALFDQNLPPLTDSDLLCVRAAVPELADLLRVSKPTVYARLFVENARPALCGLQKEASFLCETPPRFSLPAETMQHRYLLNSASSDWLSGQENLASPNQIPTPSSYDPTLPVSGSTSSGGYSSSGHSSFLPSSNTAFTRARSGPSFASAPITIVAGASLPNMTQRFDANVATANASRQTSEQSSKFGTPDEHPSAVNVLYPAVRQSIDEEIARDYMQTSQHSDKTVVSHPRVATCVITQQQQTVRTWQQRANDVSSPTQTDVVSDLGGILLDGSSTSGGSGGSNNSNGSQAVSVDDEAWKKSQLQQRVTLLEAKLADSERELQASKKAADVSQNEANHLRSCLQSLTTQIKSSLLLLRTELTSTKSSVAALNSQSVDWLNASKQTIADCVSQLKANLQRSFDATICASIQTERETLDGKLKDLNGLLTDEKQKVQNAEKKADLLQAYLSERDEMITSLKQQHDAATALMAEEQARVFAHVELERKELVKHYTIDHELELDEMRKQYSQEVAEKETEICRLKSDVSDRDQLIAHMRDEQDRLVASLLDHEISEAQPSSLYGFASASDRLPPASQGEEALLVEDGIRAAVAKVNEDHEQQLRSMRAELETNFKDKLQFLQNGLEEKNKSILERKEVEHRIERDSLQRKIAELQDAHTSILAELQAYLNSDLHVKSSSAVDTNKNLSFSEAPMESEECQTEAAVCAHCGVGSASARASSNSVSLQCEMVQSFAPLSFQDSASNNNNVANDNMTTSIMADAADVSAALLSDCSGQSTPAADAVPSDRSATARQQQSPSSFVSVTSIHASDVVLIVYNDKHASFVVFSVLPVMHFVDKSSCVALGLISSSSSTATAAASSSSASAAASSAISPAATSSEPQAILAGTSRQGIAKAWTLARVVKKEYCVAKRDKNRFGVSKGTKFYVVAAEPLPSNKKSGAPSSALSKSAVNLDVAAT